ncbi:MAG: hypothetical protein JSW04_07440 [Desulfobacterales bacterium]|nr:MAG: hypothetical protein JSW04_07440 [Desulfobacterales bacterium]
MATKIKFILTLGSVILTLSIHNVCAEEVFVKSKILKLRHVIAYLQTYFVDVIESEENNSDAKLEEVFGIYQTGKEAEIYFELSYWTKVDIGEGFNNREQKFEKKSVAFIRLNSGKWFNPNNFLYLTK